MDLVDEHFYRPESWFLAQGNRYDNYDQRSEGLCRRICFVMEKAKMEPFNAALMEAAFMTGLERNADVVHMATMHLCLLMWKDGSGVRI